MSVTTKTAGQVAHDAYHGLSEDVVTPENYKALAGEGAEWHRNSLGNRFARVADAVIAHHEANRPAWPPMRPMSESMGPWAMIRLRDRDELGPRPVRIKLRRDARPMWEDLFTGEWYSEAEIQGWWPLPEVPR